MDKQRFGSMLAVVGFADKLDAKRKRHARTMKHSVIRSDSEQQWFSRFRPSHHSEVAGTNPLGPGVSLLVGMEGNGSAQHRQSDDKTRRIIMQVDQPGHLNGEKIDEMSAKLFPLLFTAFNIFYWFYYIGISGGIF
uniref:Neur_chan_memb domain-containing protein n=1 Tax=Angiostrongylus cantonensis TaxID=6313 RepID=A0A0K0D5Z9_ANGCA